MKFIKAKNLPTILLITFIVIAFVGYASPISALTLPGANIATSKITVGDDSQIFAIADSNYLQGGHMQLPNTTAMFHITPERRSVGMTVTTVDTGTTYRLVSNPHGALGLDVCATDPLPVTDGSLDGADFPTVCNITQMSNWSLMTDNLTIGTMDDMPKSADGAVIDSDHLYMQTADALNPGLVSTTTQTFAGDKTINGSLTLNNTTLATNILTGINGHAQTVMTLGDNGILRVGDLNGYNTKLIVDDVTRYSGLNTLSPDALLDISDSTFGNTDSITYDVKLLTVGSSNDPLDLSVDSTTYDPTVKIQASLWGATFTASGSISDYAVGNVFRGYDGDTCSGGYSDSSSAVGTIIDITDAGGGVPQITVQYTRFDPLTHTTSGDINARFYDSGGCENVVYEVPGGSETPSVISGKKDIITWKDAGGTSSPIVLDSPSMPISFGTSVVVPGSFATNNKHYYPAVYEISGSQAKTKVFDTKNINGGSIFTVNGDNSVTAVDTSGHLRFNIDPTHSLYQMGGIGDEALGQASFSIDNSIVPSTTSKTQSFQVLDNVTNNQFLNINTASGISQIGDINNGTSFNVYSNLGSLSTPSSTNITLNGNTYMQISNPGTTGLLGGGFSGNYTFGNTDGSYFGPGNTTFLQMIDDGVSGFTGLNTSTPNAALAIRSIALSLSNMNILNTQNNNGVDIFSVRNDGKVVSRGTDISSTPNFILDPSNLSYQMGGFANNTASFTIDANNGFNGINTVNPDAALSVKSLSTSTSPVTGERLLSTGITGPNDPMLGPSAYVGTPDGTDVTSSLVGEFVITTPDLWSSMPTPPAAGDVLKGLSTSTCSGGYGTSPDSPIGIIANTPAGTAILFGTPYTLQFDIQYTGGVGAHFGDASPSSPCNTIYDQTAGVYITLDTTHPDLYIHDVMSTESDWSLSPDIYHASFAEYAAAIGPTGHSIALDGFTSHYFHYYPSTYEFYYNVTQSVFNTKDNSNANIFSVKNNHSVTSVDAAGSLTFNLDPNAQSYGIGDLGGANTQLALHLDGSLATVSGNHYSGTTSAVYTPAGLPGVDDLTVSGHTGATDTYTITIAGVNCLNIGYNPQIGTPFTLSNPSITDTDTGAAGTFIEEPSTHHIIACGTTGTFSIGSHISDGIGGNTAKVASVSSLFEIYNAFATGAATYNRQLGPHEIITSPTGSLSFGWPTPFTGHSLGDYWTITTTAEYGNMLALDGSANSYSIGDLSNLGHGTVFSIDDASQITTLSDAAGTYFSLTPTAHSYSIGDVSGVNTRLALHLDGALATISGNESSAGSGAVTYHPIGSPALDDLITPSGFSGTSDSYTVTVDESYCIVLKHASGTFTAGHTVYESALPTDPITPSSVVGTVVYDLGGGSNIKLCNVHHSSTPGGTFVTNYNLIDTSSPVTSKITSTGAALSAFFDTYDWTDSVSSGTKVKMTSSETITTSAGSVDFGWSAPVGHAVGDSWTWSYTMTYGNMMALDGAANTYSIGDISAIGYNSVLKINDTLKDMNFAVGANKFLNVDNLNSIYNLGDMDSSNHGNYLSIDDAASDSSFYGNRGITIAPDSSNITLGNIDDITWSGSSSYSVPLEYRVWVSHLGFGGALSPDWVDWQATLVGSSTVVASGTGVHISAGTHAIGPYGAMISFGVSSGHTTGSSSSNYWLAYYTATNGKSLDLNGASHQYTLGDVDTIQNGTQFKIDDTAKTANINVLGNPYFSIDQTAETYQIGDLAGTDHGTYMGIDGSTQSAIFSSTNDFTVASTGRSLHLDTLNNYYTMGDIDGTTGPYFGLGTYSGTSYNGLRLGSNASNLLVKGNFDTFDISLGDVNSYSGGTFLNVLNSTNTIDANGLVGTNYSYSLVTFTGFGSNDFITPTGVGIGTLSPETLTVVGINDGQLVTMSSGSVGDTITSASGGLCASSTTAATGTITAVIGTSRYIHVTCGDFTGSTAFYLNGSGLAVLGSGISGLSDMFTYTLVGGGTSGAIVMSSITIDGGISIAWSAGTGHHLGDTWSFVYTSSYGRMLSLDGAARTFKIGDVDAVGNSTLFKIDDSTQISTITNGLDTNLYINGSNYKYIFGDVLGTHNDTALTLDDANSLASFKGSRSSDTIITHGSNIYTSLSEDVTWGGANSYGSVLHYKVWISNTSPYEFSWKEYNITGSLLDSADGVALGSAGTVHTIGTHGATVAFAAASGYSIGSLTSNVWSSTYYITHGNTLALDGANDKYSLGDLNTVGNGLALNVDDSVGKATFSGSLKHGTVSYGTGGGTVGFGGPSDLSFSTTSTASQTVTFKVRIDANNYFSWSAEDAGGNILLTGGDTRIPSTISTPVPLAYGVNVSFGHTGSAYLTTYYSSGVYFYATYPVTNGSTLSLDSTNKIYKLGDVDNTGNKTLFTVDDSAGSTVISGYQGALFNATGNLTTRDVKIGNLDPVYGNNTVLDVNDAINMMSVSGERGYYVSSSWLGSGGIGPSGVTFGVNNIVTVADPGVVCSVWIDGTGTPDTFAYDCGAGTVSGNSIVAGTPIGIGTSGFNVTFTSSTGHTVGGGVNSWHLNYDVNYGNMLKLDGGNHAFTMGDVDAVGNGTVLKIDDINQVSSFAGGPSRILMVPTVTADTVASSGPALDDITWYPEAVGSFTSPVSCDVWIDGTGTPDTFTESCTGGGSSFGYSGVAIPSAGGHIALGTTFGNVYISFGHTTGHTVGDGTHHWVVVYDPTVLAGYRARGLVLNSKSDMYTMGDVDGYHNATTLSIDDSSAHMVSVNGDLTVTGSVSTCVLGTTSGSLICSSDARLKTDVVDLSSALDEINKLRPVTFKWLDPKKDQSTNIGFIAQEVQQIFPQFVGSTGDGYLGVNYAALITPTIKAVQELSLKLTDATSLDTTKPTTLGSLVTKFLSDAMNGIQQIFAKQVTTDELCIKDVCLTKDELQKVLNQANVISADPVKVAKPAASQTTDPVVTPTTPVVDTTTAPTDTTTPVDTTTPAPTPTPDPTPVADPAPVVAPAPDTTTQNTPANTTQNTDSTTPVAAGNDSTPVIQ